MRRPTFTELWYRCVEAVFFCAAVAFSVLVNMIADPSHSQGLVSWLWLWLILAVASGALGIYIHRVKRTPNHKITWTRNGLTILSVFASAIAFNFPPSWKTPLDAVPLWSTLIGWIFIFLSLALLEPIWKAETKDKAEIKALRLEIVKLKLEAANRKATVGNRDLLQNGGKARGGKK
ncbi:hypothetical protein Arth_4501 (plasmid) [Arthrobacter sp. FB24]|uniref:hypothetical protein n=1 Tax=Arthrobacter sp. (strain FB24) TaxID=290399 RepID=UPI0000526F68|nr:hypothetical protein [Arthrobacter sp. FB24]ABK05670.1 hypothetical protein Arth_4501 [Arthrobacter sp. FB24]